MLFEPPPFTLPTEADTCLLAATLAPLLRVGDALLLHGHLGAGKTAFARALIRTRLGAPQEEVPSPTFTLVQTYPHSTGDIWHADLYRLGHPDEAYELGFDDAFGTAICLIEWPDRLGTLAPKGALHLTFSAAAGGHCVALRGPADWSDRLAEALRDWPVARTPEGANARH